MAATTRNNWLGLQGMFLVTDNWTNKLGLPYRRYDVPLMVSERSLDPNNQLVPVMSHMTPMTGPMAPPNDATVGDRILVNGRYAPYLNVATHRYRLRLLNTSPFTTYDFALSDGRPFVQVGTGNGLLPRRSSGRTSCSARPSGQTWWSTSAASLAPTWPSRACRG